MAFEQLTAPGGVVWRRSSLLHGSGVPHGFSTRIGGVSPAPFDSLNLGLADAPGEPDAWERVQRNWQLFMQATGLQAHRLVRARQVHGTCTLQPDGDGDAVRSEPPFRDGDALVTGERTHALAVRVADCAPVLLADARAGIVAAVHAGWRGTVGGIVGEAIGVMVQRGAVPSRILAAVGPCIGAAAFQVGDEVGQAFSEAGLGEAIRPDPQPGKVRIDLRAALGRQLAACGIALEHIEIDPTCTVTDAVTQFSYRRDGARSGRMAAIIGL